jgi:hypothetical protein
LLDIVVGKWFVEWLVEWFVEQFVGLSEVSLWWPLSKGFLLEWRSTGEGVTLIVSEGLFEGFVRLVLFFLGWTVKRNVSLPAASEAGSTGFVVLFFCFGEGASNLSEVGWIYVHWDAAVIGMGVALILSLHCLGVSGLCPIVSRHGRDVCGPYPLILCGARVSY